MNHTDTYNLILIGLRIRGLRHTSSDTNVKFIKQTIYQLRNELEEVGFNVVLAGFDYFLERTLDNIEKLDEEREIGEANSILEHEMHIVESTVFAEARTKKIFTLPDRRFNTKYLFEQPEKLLKLEVFDNLSEIAKYDFESSCRCLLFGESTASAFHILRATEETLKQYYYHYQKNKRLKKPMWGPMTVQLKAKRTNKPDEIILKALDVVRTSYRNPTQHPEVIYDIESAQDLLGVCIDLINKMVSVKIISKD